MAIARALAGRAPILLADEPTANLDHETGTQVLDLFQGLAQRDQRALLIVTHDPGARDRRPRRAHPRRRNLQLNSVPLDYT